MKSAKTWLSRRTWFYRALFRSRSLLFAVYELISVAASRGLRREVLFGIDVLSIPEEPAALRHGLAACLRFKNEAPYLAEWLEYHRLVGFDHFYLYNNNSTDDFEAVLEPYVQEGLVTLHDWPGTPASPAADLHCIRTYRRQARWIAFIDADEFLFPLQSDGVKDILQQFEHAAALAVNWIYFGSNGHTARPEGLVLESFTARAPAPNRHVKSVVNPRKVIRYGNSHHWFYRGGELAVNENGTSVYGSFSEPPAAKRIRINHYYSKSEEEFLAKAAQKTWVDREGARFPSRRPEASAAAARAHNEVIDRSACRFAQALELPARAVP